MFSRPWSRIPSCCRLSPRLPSRRSRGFSAAATGTLRRSNDSLRLVSAVSVVGVRNLSLTRPGDFRWSGRKADDDGGGDFTSVADGLKRLYRQKLLPLEKRYLFHEFHSPLMTDADFDARPIILLVGQYSTGKTTFIRYLLERDFPGIRVGPEPTTDKFIVIAHADEDGIIPGNALVVDPTKQFKPLSKFGNTFLNKFQCSTTDSEILKSLVIVDTPGILSGEKQRVDRGYSFSGVVDWFADRADRVILLFDAHKLDISDEFKRVIEGLRPHDDKIRIVLNKADSVDGQQLMRVYGALMWSLGKILSTPEVARVFAGSFWERPLRADANHSLFEAEEADLLGDLRSLPRNAQLRKLNDLIKRARLAKVHAHVIADLRSQMPRIFGKEDKRARLIEGLDAVFRRIQLEKGFSPGDFPDVDAMRTTLRLTDFDKLAPLDAGLLTDVDEMLQVDIAKLVTTLSLEKTKDAVAAPRREASPSPPSSGTVDALLHSSVQGAAAVASTVRTADGHCESHRPPIKLVVDEDSKASDAPAEAVHGVAGSFAEGGTDISDSAVNKEERR